MIAQPQPGLPASVRARCPETDRIVRKAGKDYREHVRSEKGYHPKRGEPCRGSMTFLVRVPKEEEGA